VFIRFFKRKTGKDGKQTPNKKRINLFALNKTRYPCEEDGKAVLAKNL
jgi:hypothetical protein